MSPRCVRRQKRQSPGSGSPAASRCYQLRFIEQMPLDAQHGWRRTDMVTADVILARPSLGSP